MRPDRSCFIPLFGELRIANVAAQTRIVSVARIRLDSWKSVRSFKGIFYNDISEFESDHLSHAVRSLWRFFRGRLRGRGGLRWSHRRNRADGAELAIPGKDCAERPRPRR